MRKRIRFQSIHELVASYPRTVTQGEIARELGISESSLSNYLKGRPPSRETALRLRRDFGVSLEGLLDRTAV
jgi:transcriptional regulator with XRE-family HTH domain